MLASQLSEKLSQFDWRLQRLCERKASTNSGPKPANQTLQSDGQNLTLLYTLCAHTLVFAERQTQVESAADVTHGLLLLHGTFFQRR